jgi:hypothetical protein
MFRLTALLVFSWALAACSLPSSSGSAATHQAIRPAQLVRAPSVSERQCLTQLSATQANFSPLPDKYYGAHCATLDTVKLTALRSDHASLAVSNLGPVTCPLAETFAAWARYGVDRAARVVLGSPLVRIETFGSYNCRNVAGSDRLSAHATANAIDVAAFDLADGRRIAVKADWSGGTPAEKEFLRIVHTSACKRFGTVLGPGYNAAHKDHFHLENSATSFCR